MSKKDEQKIGDLLQRMIKKDKKLEQNLLSQKLKEAWKEMAGPMINKYTYNVFFSKGKLYVKLTSSVLRHELRMGKQKLINNLNEKIGEKLIEDIVLK
jgi:predicted nucleic acid-binding Zn ribbon protein